MDYFVSGVFFGFLAAIGAERLAFWSGRMATLREYRRTKTQRHAAR